MLRGARRGRAPAPAHARRSCLRLVEHPLAVAAAEDDAWRVAAGLDVEDRLVLVGARAVDDLDERQLVGLGAALLGVDAARGGLEASRVPAAVLGRGGGEVVVDLRERALERGACARELRGCGR